MNQEEQKSNNSIESELPFAEVTSENLHEVVSEMNRISKIVQDKITQFCQHL